MKVMEDKKYKNDIKSLDFIEEMELLKEIGGYLESEKYRKQGGNRGRRER